MIAPPWFPVPPPDYGGTERVCALLARGLAERGNEVTLYASGDSMAPVPLRFSIKRHDPGRLRWPETEARHLAFALAESGEYDVVHDNSSVFGPLLFSLTEVPTMHTVHGGLDDADARAVYALVCDRIDLIALSGPHRDDAPELRWADVIPNPVDVDALPFVTRKDDYVAFLGRLAPSKAPHLAIEAARRAGTRIVVAGPVHEVDRDYFAREVAPLLDGDGVSYVGSVGGADRDQLLARARAVLMPTSWSEPFGLVAVEAMACGTPVIAFPRGALSELVVGGVTGLLVEDVETMAEAIGVVDRLDPADCREDVQRRFSIESVSERYEAALARTAARSPGSRMPAQGVAEARGVVVEDPV